MVVRKLQSLAKAPVNRFLYRSRLLFCVFIISCLQSATLALGEIGHQVVTENLDQLPGVLIPFPLFLNHLSRLGGVKTLLTRGSSVIPLFLVQSSFALVYGLCESRRSKRITALVIWLLPAMISLPTLVGPIIYLMSAIYPFILLDLVSGNLDKEEIAEGWAFTLASLGWFHLFWLGITIKNWFFLRSWTDRVTQ